MYNKLSSRIKALRIEHGFKSQQSFADFLNVHLKTVQGWERKDNPKLPDLDNLLTICTKFNIDLDYLTGRIEEKTHDIKALCELSGLTPAAAEIVQRHNLPGNMTPQALSALIESEQLTNFVASFFTFLNLCKEYKDYDIHPGQFKFLQTDGDRVIMTADEAIYHYMNKTSMIMQSICEENLHKIQNGEK